MNQKIFQPGKNCSRVCFFQWGGITENEVLWMCERHRTAVRK